MPALKTAAPGPATLVATGCGTAIACVCALDLGELERRLGGLWSVLAVAGAALLCGALARALGRLSTVVPSGAGLMAFLSRGLGRRFGLVLMLPYVALVISLVAVEARIVGAVSARLLPISPAVGALAFLGWTWAVARSGLRPGLRAQAVATGVLMVGFSLLAIAGVISAARRPDFAVHLLPAAPSPLALLGGIGQALFLFMGFELVTNQVELVRAPGAIGSALSRSVQLLTVFYVLMALGFSTIDPANALPPGPPGLGADGAWLTPQLGFGAAAGSRLGAAAIGLLCMLASFTSFNGALLTLSRLVYALAAQGMLPRRLARMDAKRMVPANALTALLAAAVALAFLLSTRGLINAVLAGSAAAAGLVWAAAVAVRERPPFVEPGRPRRHLVAALAVASLFVVFGGGALVEALSPPAPLLVEVVHAH
jgi:APA family basic amino acid/polyamine antiporter